MTIDIIDYTASQLAALSTGRLQAIRSAQVKKNNLLQALEKDLQKAKERLMDRGVFASTVWENLQASMTEACNAEVERVRQSLLFYLHYVDVDVPENGGHPEDVPYSVNYALSEEERMVVVRNYYMNTYTNNFERFRVYANDAFAKGYLGEMYAPLYHYLQDLI